MYFGGSEKICSFLSIQDCCVVLCMHVLCMHAGVHGKIIHLYHVPAALYIKIYIQLCIVLKTFMFILTGIFYLVVGSW